jgi:hypothetical protein
MQNGSVRERGSGWYIKTTKATKNSVAGRRIAGRVPKKVHWMRFKKKSNPKVALLKNK